MIPDVAVVGGGIVGTATAAFLAARGVRVTLFERTELGAGASGRNSGIVQQPFDAVLAGLYWQSLELYRELAAELPGSFRLDARPAGLLYVGPAAADSAARGLAAAWTAAYPDTGAELVTGTALRNLDPALAYDLVACRLDIGYPAAPASATRAYAALAERLGASIVIGGDARLVVRDGVAVGVEVDGRLVEAGSVVVAAGPWSPDVLTAVGATSPRRGRRSAARGASLPRSSSSARRATSSRRSTSTSSPTTAATAARRATRGSASAS